jgi:hypothetical protein
MKKQIMKTIVQGLGRHQLQAHTSEKGKRL